MRKTKIEDELKKLKGDFIVLTILPSEQYENVNLALLKILVNKMGYKGGYISVNRPYQNLTILLNNNKINPKSLFFIDCVSRQVKEQDDVKNCVFIDAPTNLTEISIAADNVLRDKGKRFIFIDSLDTLTLYNNAETVIRFAHNLINKMRMHNTSGVILSLHDDTDKKMIDELAQFCDKVIDLR